MFGKQDKRLEMIILFFLMFGVGLDMISSSYPAFSSKRDMIHLPSYVYYIAEYDSIHDNIIPLTLLSNKAPDKIVPSQRWYYFIFSLLVLK